MTEDGPRTISIRSTSASDSLETLAVPARWPLISTRTWLLKSRPWPSVAPPRMLIEVWPGVHSLRKPTAYSARMSATDFAVDRSIWLFSMTWTAPTKRPVGSLRPVGVTTWLSAAVPTARRVATGLSAVVGSRPMTCTVPVVRLRGSGRPVGVTTTSGTSSVCGALVCADEAESRALAASSTAAVAAERSQKLSIVAPVDTSPCENRGFSGNFEPVPAWIAFCLTGKMRGHFRTAVFRPSQPVGEIDRELLEIGDHARERPFRVRDRARLRRRRKAAEYHLDARGLVLAVPRRRKAAGEAHPARPMLRRHDPSHGAACPGEATREEGVRLLERRGDVGGENGVMHAAGDIRGIPAGGDEMRRIVQARQPRTHARRRLDCGPAAARHAQRLTELTAAGADVEQITDIPHALTDERRNSRHVVGGVDACGVELERIDGALRDTGMRRRLRCKSRRRSIYLTIRRE